MALGRPGLSAKKAPVALGKGFAARRNSGLATDHKELLIAGEQASDHLTVMAFVTCSLASLKTAQEGLEWSRGEGRRLPRCGSSRVRTTADPPTHSPPPRLWLWLSPGLGLPSASHSHPSPCPAPGTSHVLLSLTFSPEPALPQPDSGLSTDQHLS